MSHARIEEVSDSDPEIDDPSDYLPQSDNAIIRTIATEEPEPDSDSDSEPSSKPPRQAQPSQPPQNPYLGSGPSRPSPSSAADYQRSRAAIKHYCTLYPCYFSSSRTRSQGRRVSKSLSSPNPLAFSILHAVQAVLDPERNRIHVAFEPDKTHPKDWANPGRVRIELFSKETHDPRHPTIHNKEHLYREVAAYLQSHPTKASDPLDLKIQGLPVPANFADTKVQAPRGWGVMNQILPLHSPAVSGGGVKDDFFKEAMAELAAAQGGGGDGGMAGLAQMMQGMGGMGGMGGLQGLMGGGGGASGGAGEGASASSAAKKKGGKKK